MFKHLSVSFAILCTVAFAAGCSDKASPKSTTTTRTQTTVDQAGGERTTTDVTEKRTEQADGTKDVETTSTTTSSTPPTP